MAGKTVTVEQTGSPIRREAKQRATLIGLGLNRIRRRSTLQDTKSVRGMIAAVHHLVRIVEGDHPKTTKNKVEDGKSKTTTNKADDKK